ncbi:MULTISPECIES: (2,3-dihydroxybenzoyl)adenylate synthase [unclassified Streptomyces]|uniref:(2,3-dihydroxybenzoyl)adenylate synthase n=1 Tax=unclassified Streptomyces TaxID=2593676 RepID=UPI000BAC9F1D|nr:MULTISPECIES: (2,3-dihydroxybenzoyl)adenylate synthase [unclassified Streptomyces]ASY31511.1 2,3-dihydroxybenzoate-AMP ligase [Streptomyces sp. CLI2509]MYX24504.1 AMP-binding protein [Streptomyces sp. SID8380]
MALPPHPSDPGEHPVHPTHPTWPPAAAERYRRAGYWRGRTFGQEVTDWARQRPGRTALVDGARRWTYAELAAESGRLAVGLRGLGIRRGDRVVVQLPNVAEFVLLWFALQRLGAVPVHAMPGHRRAELTHLVRLSGAVACVVPDRHARHDHLTLMREVLAGLPDPSACRVVVVGDPGPHEDFVPYADLRAGESSGTLADEDPPEPGDLALLLLSGGTTGLPKLIPRTHDDYAYNASAAAGVCGLDEHSVYLAVLPAAFNFTLACPGVLGTLFAGGTVVLAPDPSPQTGFALIAREGVTLTALSPPLVPHWIEEARADPGSTRSLRVVQVGGARLPDALAARLGPALGVTVQQVYGMAEGLLNLTRLDDPAELIRTTQGRPLSPDDDILVVDPDGAPVPDGEPGELLTRGPYTPRGYYRAAAHNARAFTPEGHYRTGDLVRRLPSGHLVVVGRVKDQINRGGEKIAATEVEEHLLTHPRIGAAALVGVADPQRGERAVAFVTCPAAPHPDVHELSRYLREERGLAAYKVPDQVIVLAALPLTPVGKVDKKALAGQAPD